MNVVGKVSSFITQGVYSVATTFHPFGGAVDIIVVEQHDRTFRSTPWYVRFGKFQGVLKGAEKVVRVEVNGVEANFNMYLDNSGEAYFVREIDQGKDDCEDFNKESDNIVDEREDNSTGHGNIDICSKENDCLAQDTNGYSNDGVELQDEQATLGMDLLERVESDANRIFYELQDEKSSLEDSLELSEYDSSAYSNLDSEHALKSQNSNSEVVLVSVDGHVLTAPISSSERKAENKELNTPQFHLSPSEGTEKYNIVEDTLTTDSLSGLDVTADEVTNENICKGNDETLSSEVHVEPCGGEGKHLYHRHKTQVSADQDKEFCIDCNFDDIVNSFQSHEVFKGCLELQKLAVQSPTDDQEKVASSMKILEAADDSKENHHLSPSVNKAEDGNLEMSRDNDKLPRDNSENPISVCSTQVEAATLERNISDMDLEGTDSMPVQYTSSNHGALKQVEVKPTVRKMHSREESPVLNEYDENEHAESHICASVKDFNSDIFKKLEISLCGNLLHAGMGLRAAQAAFDANRISAGEFKLSAMSIVKNENLIVRLKGQYIPWDKVEHIILGMAACGLDLSVEPQDVIPVEQETQKTKEDDTAPSRGWSLWPIPFRRVKTLEQGSNNSLNEEVFADSDSASQSQHAVTTSAARAFTNSPCKKIIRTNVPTTDQIASLNLKEGRNMVNFIFSTRVLGSQKVEAHIYLWKWNARIVISDVDGTITKSDVLGQFMPLVGKDWTHSGIARLFCAIKENGYQLLFLSARAIVQSYLTKSFLFNLKQDGKSLPSGPVVISPDGLFPSLYREVIRRTPHEFKIACLEGIKALFPPDYNPFYAGFGNRDTDELSYRKIGIPKGKILIINPKGEVAINRQIDVKSYTSLHTLVNDMFPPRPLVEQEDYNSWNYWKMPLPEVDDL